MAVTAKYKSVNIHTHILYYILYIHVAKYLWHIYAYIVRKIPLQVLSQLQCAFEEQVRAGLMHLERKESAFNIRQVSLWLYIADEKGPHGSGVAYLPHCYVHGKVGYTYGLTNSRTRPHKTKLQLATMVTRPNGSIHGHC